MKIRFGISHEHYQILDEIVIQPLKKHGARVYLFGSRVLGKNHAYSDVDLLYNLPAGCSLPAGLIGGITEAIEESSFPYKVDIVNEADLANSYRDRVNAEKIEIVSS